MQDQFKYESNYSFVLNSSDHQSEFVDAYKEPLQEMGIRLTMLENNGEAYWASVTPIRRSLSSDLLIFGVLMVVAFILAVFLYQMQHKREYAILRAMGVPTRQANHQFVLPLLLLGGIGIIAGGIPSWTYALGKAAETLSTLATPGGVTPSTELSILHPGWFMCWRNPPSGIIFLVGSCFSGWQTGLRAAPGECCQTVKPAKTNQNRRTRTALTGDQCRPG